MRDKTVKTLRQGPIPLKVIAALSMLSMLLQTGSTCHAEEAVHPSPTKASLIATLDAVLPHLEKNELAAASEFFVLPPNFKPEMLDGFVDRQEISLEGIRCLEQEARFAKAADLFGDERARNIADRASADVHNCYGFKHEASGEVAEVVALWGDGRFKLVRLDDVGKIQLGSATGSATASESVTVGLPQLGAAVEQDPSNVAARANYAMALYQLGNLPAAWHQLFAARKLEPNHGGVTKGIGVLLTDFERRGLFTVGTPKETIELLLGPTDTKVDLGTRQRWVYAYLAVDFASNGVHEIIDLRGATEALFLPTEYVSVNLDGRGWRCGHRKKSRGNSAAYYYLPGQSIANWTEQFEVERILDAASIGSMEEVARTMVNHASQQHPDSTNRLLHLDDESATFAFELPAHQDFAKRHKLVHLMMGGTDVHRISYSLQVDQPSEETQRKWLAIVHSATLTAVDAR